MIGWSHNYRPCCCIMLCYYLQTVCVMCNGFSSFCNLVNHGPVRHLLFQHELCHFSKTPGIKVRERIALLSFLVMLKWLLIISHLWMLHTQVLCTLATQRLNALLRRLSRDGPWYNNIKSYNLTMNNTRSWSILNWNIRGINVQDKSLTIRQKVD